MFELAQLTPTDIQASAVDDLQTALAAKHQATLLGVTGSGKTLVMAALVERMQRTTLVIAHNKTLAAQLYQEFRRLLPNNSVEYFISYYDYYRPEAYVPSKSLFIEKEVQINSDIERLRHSATAALMSQSDTLVVASVSCLYGLGDPTQYQNKATPLQVGQAISRDAVIEGFIAAAYKRNDVAVERGSFRVKGDRVDIWPSGLSHSYAIEWWGDEIEAIHQLNPALGEKIAPLKHVAIYPNAHYTVDPADMDTACARIMSEMEKQEAVFLAENKLIEAQRIRERCLFDIENLQQLGFTSGVENYSAVFEGRTHGQTPFCLLDYLPKDALVIVDESHQTIPQIRGMSAGDRSRKQTLVDWGFRLPSALDNRPQTFAEFRSKVPNLLCVSATPGEYETTNITDTVEVLVRPTGIPDPVVSVIGTTGQAEHLLKNIKEQTAAGHRTLVTTLTKKMAERLTTYLTDMGIKAEYMHSDVDTLDRIIAISKLRSGEFDVLVGVNLLREGLDLPEVGLVAILDADKEGFLRGKTALIQTIGRAARNPAGKVILYADKESNSMREAIEETARRRTTQIAYNKALGITPSAIAKSNTLADFNISMQPAITPVALEDPVAIEEAMLAAAADLRFEEAAALRDRLQKLTA